MRIEAESARFRGGEVESKSAASAGKVLGGGWGATASDRAEYRFALPAEQDVILGLRYAFDREQFLRRFPDFRDAHVVRASLDGHPAKLLLDCVDTSDWNVFSWLRAPLGRLAAGEHSLVLEPVKPHSDLNLDALVIGSPAFRPDTRAATTWPEQSRHFRVRLSPRVDPTEFPARQVFTNLEAQYAFHRDFLGFDLDRKGLLTVIAAADWSAGGATAYTNEGNIYLQEREITHPGDNYAHEMFHMFEAGLGYPTWWSEGVAFLMSVRSDAEMYGRPRQEIDAQIAALRSWWDTEGRAKLVRDGANQLPWWGSERLPRDLTARELYRGTNLMIYSLWQREGNSLFRRLYALIREDQARGAYRIPAVGFAEKNRLLLDYLDRAAGHSLRDFWREWRVSE